ncbi:MAG: bifunctional diaminohydroxyphosphoribosylaminopyrimidine deaminase/5-amino-6-(5-phosphoribosylamino)uracil reductase RibD [Acidimicrobiales bacterium]
MTDDEVVMARAMAAAATVRTTTSPNPWVGAVVRTADGHEASGATEPPGGRHAEVVALDALAAAHDRDALRGATVWSTLEPCRHTGRTAPCTDALIAAGVGRVVIGIEDPDPLVAGAGIACLRAAGIDVAVGVASDAVTAQLSPYLTHRRTGRPHVVLKLAATLDGRVAAPDGSSQWITGPEARADAHRLRAESDAVLVGAGTVRADDPSLTVRDLPGGAPAPRPDAQPLRVVLGTAPPAARIHPCLQRSGSLPDLLDELGGRGIVQVMVEGGPTVAGSFHRAGLIDRYVLYLAPALFGGDDARPVLAGAGAPSVAELWRGRITDVARLGPDLRVELVPERT